MSKKIIGVTVGSPLPKPNLKQTDPSKGDYVKGKDIIPSKVSDLENDSGYLESNKLSEAINTALAQAKESGKFTPVKGVDYFTAADKTEIAEQAAGLVEIPETDICVVYVEANDAQIPILYTTSKTSQEIFQAWNDDIPIYCYYNMSGIPIVLYPVLIGSNMVQFESLPLKADVEMLDGMRFGILIENSTAAPYEPYEPSRAPTKTSELENDSGFATAEEIAQFAAEHYQPKGDYVTEEVAEQVLNAYVKKDELPDSGGSLVVRYDQETKTANYSSLEILEYINKGYVVTLEVANRQCNVSNYNDNTVMFSHEMFSKQGTFLSTISVNKDKSASMSTVVNQYASPDDIPSDEHINALINTALGVIENGTY